MKTLKDKLIETPEGRRAYRQEELILDVTERICELMEQQGVSRSELARRLGKTKGYVTQLLDGRTNMTIRTICDVFDALGRTVCVADRSVEHQHQHQPALVGLPRRAAARSPSSQTPIRRTR